MWLQNNTIKARMGPLWFVVKTSVYCVTAAFSRSPRNVQRLSLTARRNLDLSSSEKVSKVRFAL